MHPKTSFNSTKLQNYDNHQIESNFALDKFNVAKMMISIFDGVENIVGEGESAGYQHFLPFPPGFQSSLP